MENRCSSFFLKTSCPACLGFVLCAALLLCAAAGQAATVTLAWDPSPDNVTGYTIFYGRQSVLTHPATEINVGNVLQKTISPLADNTTYYFALKAYNSSGQSGFSNEVTYPTTTSTSPTTSSTATSIPTTTSSSATSVATTSTVPATVTTTTSMIQTNHTLLGGKGSTLLDSSVLAAKSEQNAGAETGLAFTGLGAIAVFDEADSPLQISVGWDEYNALNGEARIATGDIDGDKKEEIIVGLGPIEGNPAIPGGKFQILDDDFSSLGWGQIDWSGYNSLNGESWPACGDIDGDGIDEILIGLGIDGGGRVEVLKFTNGKAVHSQWIKVGWDDYCLAGGGVRPACGNIDFDRKDEIILGLYPANDFFLPEGQFQILDGNAGHLAWGSVDWPDYNALNGETRPVCGDINRTMRDEILLGLGMNSEARIPVYSYGMGKVTLKKWLKSEILDFRPENGETRLSCGDIDADGLDEILIGFGRGGQGMMELHDDGLHDFSLISRLQMPDEAYNTVNGETYPAIKNAKNQFPKIMDLFLKSFSKKNKK